MQSSAYAESPRHSHVFDEGNPLAERNTRLAVVLTAVMMVAEIIGGWLFNSMALLADGWHMSSHALALGLSVLAYGAARRFAHDARFAFGTWKIEVLGGYTSAIYLVGVAGLMLFQSVERLISPSPIRYDQAIAIAGVGLLVNLACAWLLRDGHAHHDHGHQHRVHEYEHDHEHQHGGHGHHGHDLNLRSAYLHVVADAATSVLAILALIGGKFWGANWLDPAMGVVGAGLVGVWAYGLLRDTGRVLLDAEMDVPVVAEIRDLIEASPVKAEITDLHVWRVGKGKFACILSLSVTDPAMPDYFREQLSIHEELVHVTVEVMQRKGEPKVLQIDGAFV
ncbi:MAG: cation transporter [Geobacteraceae bacterium GWC2_58_44]|nr:MAG: cation transporter [Geobacteraceae bacterium GWC2_58_44]HBG06671.1 cation transporter [Geobacter sp.]